MNAMIFIIVNSTKDTAKNGKPYAKLQLRDSQKTIYLTVWDCFDNPQRGQIVKVLNYKDNDGFLSATRQQVEIYDDAESPLQEFLPKPPTQAEWNTLCEMISVNTNMQHGSDFYSIAVGCYKPFSKSTAARSNHHAFIGGLAKHTYEMLKMTYALISNKALPYHVDTDVVFFSILFHDFGKIDEYETKDFSYKPAMFMQGHPYLSAHYMRTLVGSKVTPGRLQAIEHCILAHHMFKEWGSPVTPCNQEALLVATVDMLSGHGTQLAESPDLAPFNTTKVIHVKP